MAALRLTLLGGVEARLATGPTVSFPRKKSEALLAYLALHAGQMQARDKLAALLWGEASDTRARHSLRQALVSLRQALPRETGPLLLENGDAVAINPAVVEVDVPLFEQLLADGSPEALERAAGLYRGDLLEGLAIAEPPFEEWLTAERERLREMGLEALVRLLAHQIRIAVNDEAVQTAIRVLRLDPTQESVHRSLMRLYARQGRRGAALRQYQICIATLERELGVEPEPETKQLYRDLLQAPEAARSLPAPAVDVRGPQTDCPTSDAPLVGRQAELARIRAALDEAWQGRGAVALVQGEAGVGKSRLVEAIVAMALEAGGRVLLGRAYESEQILPFSPWVDALRAGQMVPDMLAELNEVWRGELARLFPELGRGTAEPPAGEDYVRLFEALSRVVQYLASRRPLLIILEDLHWADEMSHRLMVFLSRRIHDWPVLVVGTLRIEELVDAPVLRRSVSQLARQPRFVSVSLAPLSEAETGALVRALSRTSLEETTIKRVADRLWRASEGNPLMVVESLRVLHGRELATLGEDPVMPAPVRDLIAGRLERLTARGRRMAGVASVIGRGFDFPVLTHAAGISDAEAAEGVEELVARRILHAIGERLDFTHERIREVAGDLVLSPQRKLLHGAVARALEALHAEDLAAHALALGRHYAASETWDRAWFYLAQAGTQAASRYAHREAVACFEKALSLTGHLPATPELTARSIDLRFALRQSCVPLRDHQRILDHLQHAEQAARTAGDRLRFAWALVYRIHGLFLAGDGSGAVAAGQRAWTIAEQVGDPALQESAAFYLAQAQHWLGNYAQGAELLRRSVTSFESELVRHGLPARQFVNSRMLLAWCLAERGEFGEALARADEAIQAAEKHAMAYDLVHAYSGAGLVHLRRGEFAAAIAASDRAVELCRGRDFSALWAIAASILGPAYTAAGRVGEAIPLLEHAAEIAAELGAPILGFLAEAYLVAGQVDEAQMTAGRAIRLAWDRGERGWEAWNLRMLGKIAACRPEGVPEAAEYYARALTLAEALGMRPLVAHCHLSLGALYPRFGDADRAREHLARAVSAYRELDMPSWRAEAESEWSRTA
ncbi:MAG TPA: AAA family ATPase [Vicinamibacteria bacterium]|nr:AAA family ATPase [Vicinamibacteria bacterium]